MITLQYKLGIFQLQARDITQDTGASNFIQDARITTDGRYNGRPSKVLAEQRQSWYVICSSISRASMLLAAMSMVSPILNDSIPLSSNSRHVNRQGHRQLRQTATRKIPYFPFPSGSTILQTKQQIDGLLSQAALPGEVEEGGRWRPACLNSCVSQHQAGNWKYSYVLKPYSSPADC